MAHFVRRNVRSGGPDASIPLVGIHPLICKQCDVDLYGKTLLQVPFAEKEDIKDLGGRFDYLCKKWYVDDDSDVMDIILSHWEKAVPDQRNTKRPY